MAVILNIESSGSASSVALSVDGNVEWSAVEREAMHQATDLAPFVAQAMEEVTRKELKIDAVAVSTGPGSYTGLRIGMSLAKGLAFGLDVPLIGVETLKLIAVKAMFRNFNFTGDEILVPMVDARRMEVKELQQDRQIWFMGDGAPKTRDVIKLPNAHWMDDVLPMAFDMVALAEKSFREKDFPDLAYSVPFYIKDYEAVHGENPLKQLLGC